MYVCSIRLRTCAVMIASLSTRDCSSELATALIVLACSIADTTMSPGLLDVLN